MSWQNWALSWYLRRVSRPLRTVPLDVASIRRQGSRLKLPVRVPSGWRVREVTGAPGLAGEWIEPASARLARAITRTVLYLHGGAYLFCSPRTHRAITFALARHALARVFVPDYRLAPEHPAPAALDDALAAYRLIRDNGTPAEAIAVAGDSAGGGLALALLQTLRDQGAALPGAAVLFSPWTDLGLTGASIVSHEPVDVMFSARQVREAAAIYLDGMAVDDWRASPLYGAFTGLPPLLFFASDSEMLLDDTRRVVARAREAGALAQEVIVHRVPHAWPIFAPVLPEGKRTLRDAGLFIRQQLRKPA